MGEAPSDFAAGSASADECVIDGTGTAPGIAIGTAYCYDASAPTVRRDTIDPGEVDRELELLANAVQRAEQELETIRALTPEDLAADTDAIIEAQVLMLHDEDLLASLRSRIRDDCVSAGGAVQTVLSAHRARLEDSDDAYLRDRAGDLVDLEKRLLRSLRRGAIAANVDSHSVVVAQSLTATELLRFSRHRLLGCITAEGGTTSHVAIIAKALRVPVVVAEEAPAAVASGDLVIVDGGEGRLIVHPSSDTLDDYRRRQSERDVRPSMAESAPRPVETRDGRPITVRANVGVASELDVLAAYGAEGIGLLRTELFLLAEGGGTLAEERQAEAYRRVGEAAGAAGATVRLLDLGGDERVPQLHAGPREANPFLGWRGIRMLLDRPDDLLRPQVRALLRANRHAPLRMLVPMVTDIDEVHRTRAIVEEEADRLSAADVAHDPELPLGIMVEVPAAALRARAFAEAVDFLSIGTNDLTQYVLAVDRGNERVSARHDALHPAVLGLVQQTVEAGRATGTPVEVCGEVASDVQAVPILLGLGLSALSVAPQYLPAVQRIVRAVEHDEAQALAQASLAASDAASVRRRAREWVDAHVSSVSPEG